VVGGDVGRLPGRTCAHSGGNKGAVRMEQRAVGGLLSSDEALHVQQGQITLR